MRLTLVRGATAAMLWVLALFVAACGDDSNTTPPSTSSATPVAANAPSYCHQLTVPAGLEAAVRNAASGSASGSDRQVIADIVAKLRTVANDSTAPTDLRALATSTIELFDKLANNQQLTEDEATSFDTMSQHFGEAVNKACSGR